MAKNKKKSKPSKPSKTFINLYYMASVRTDVKQITEILEQNKEANVEVWPEAGVIEVELGDKQSIDLVEMADSFGSAEDQEFIRKNNIKTVFSIEVEKENLDRLKLVITPVVRQYGGFVCSDRDDFMPLIIKA